MSIEREWKQIKLKNVGECLRGVSYKPLIDLLLEKSTESCYLLRSTNIQDSKLTLRDIQIVRNSRVRDQQVLQPKDIVICMANGSKRLVGKSVQFNLEPRTYTIGAFMGIFRVKESNNTDYINYLFCTNRYKYYISTLVSGSSINNLKPSDIESLPFFIPSSFEEQKAIVSVLEKWDKFIELLDQKIQTKKNIKKYLQQVLLTGEIRLGCFKQAWEEYELGKVCKVLKGRGLSKELLEENGEMECILYGELYTKYNEIIDTVVSYTNVKEGIKSVSGDVLIPASTTTNALDVATASCIKKSGVLLGGDINIFRPSEQVDGEFLAQYLSHTKKIEMAKLAQGITIVHLYGKDIKKLKIQIPEIEEQKAISSILSKSDEEIAMLEKQKEIIEEQRKYLLNNLVTGKIRLPKFINSK